MQAAVHRISGWAIAALVLVAPHARAAEDEPRRFTFVYESVIGPLPDGGEPVQVFVPLPRDSPQQRVEREEIEADLGGALLRENAYGNRVWHGATRAHGQTLRWRGRFTVARRPEVSAPTPGPEPSPAERRQLAVFLAPNARVVVGHPVLEPILAEIRPRYAGGSPVERARAIYDWVVDNVEYKKVGTGWGNGDTFWACSERYGNCTDFHALLISLARTEGLPARFEIGFPVPEDRPRAEIGGYHCWVQLYVPGAGWVPIDASEASKDPTRRDLFFGTHPADRVLFTVGRDLELGPDQRSGPLNYLVYPHVEVGGVAWTGPVQKRFAYEATAPEPEIAGQADRAAPDS